MAESVSSGATQASPALAGIAASGGAPLAIGYRAVDGLRPHPFAERIPTLSEDERATLRREIERDGVRTSLEVSAEGVVLDGHHRLSIATELGLGRVPVQIVRAENEAAHMAQAALARQNLSQSQRAALVVDLDEFQDLAARGRQRQRANLRQNIERATLPPRGEKSRQIAARMAGVSERVVQDTATVQGADIELFREVRAGKISASAPPTGGRAPSTARTSWSSATRRSEARSIRASLRASTSDQLYGGPGSPSPFAPFTTCATPL